MRPNRASTTIVTQVEALRTLVDAFGDYAREPILTRSTIQLEPHYAAAILPRLWERTHDRALVQALARGTPAERRWRIDVGEAKPDR